MRSVLLIHGGLWGDEDAEFFWRGPGVVAALERRGVDVVAPDRVRRAGSWGVEAGALAEQLVAPVVVVGGSFGCSAAVRLALGWPDLVERLVLALPATTSDPEVHAFVRDVLAGLGASADVIAALLTGETLPGVTDAELRGLGMPVAVVPTEPANAAHPRRTVVALTKLLNAVELDGCPEPPRAGFQADGFADAVVQFGLRRW